MLMLLCIRQGSVQGADRDHEGMKRGEPDWLGVWMDELTLTRVRGGARHGSWVVAVASAVPEPRAS